MVGSSISRSAFSSVVCLVLASPLENGVGGQKHWVETFTLEQVFKPIKELLQTIERAWQGFGKRRRLKDFNKYLFRLFFSRFVILHLSFVS